MKNRLGRLLVVATALAVTTGSAGCASTKKQQGRELRKIMAVKLIEQRNWKAAFTAVRYLHAEDPEDADVLMMRGIIYREQGLTSEAEADLRGALERDEERADAHSALAVLLETEKRRDEALEHHRRAAQLAPSRSDYLNNLGFALLVRGKVDEAVSVFADALRLDPTNPRIRNNLGFAYAQMGDFRRASREFAAGGSPAQAKNNLGFAYEKDGNLAAAYDLYVQAVTMAPQMTQAEQNLAHVARTLGRPGPDDLSLAQPATNGGNDAKVDSRNKPD